MFERKHRKTLLKWFLGMSLHDWHRKQNVLFLWISTSSWKERSLCWFHAHLGDYAGALYMSHMITETSALNDSTQSGNEAQDRVEFGGSGCRRKIGLVLREYKEDVVEMYFGCTRFQGFCSNPWASLVTGFAYVVWHHNRAGSNKLVDMLIESIQNKLIFGIIRIPINFLFSLYYQF